MLGEVINCLGFISSSSSLSFGCTTKMSTSIFCQAENEYHRARNQELVNLQEESSIRQEQARRATEEKIQAQRRKTEREKLRLNMKQSDRLWQK